LVFPTNNRQQTTINFFKGGTNFVVAPQVTESYAMRRAVSYFIASNPITNHYSTLRNSSIHIFKLRLPFWIEERIFPKDKDFSSDISL